MIQKNPIKYKIVIIVVLLLLSATATLLFLKHKLENRAKAKRLIESAEQHGVTGKYSLAIKDLEEALNIEQTTELKNMMDQVKACDDSQGIDLLLDTLDWIELKALREGNLDKDLSKIQWIDHFCKSRLWSALSERSKKLNETVDSIIAKYAKPYVVLKEYNRYFQKKSNDVISLVFIYSDFAKTGKERAATSMKAAIDAQKRTKQTLVRVITELSASKFALDPELRTHAGSTYYSPIGGILIDDDLLNGEKRTWCVDMAYQNQISHDVQVFVEVHRKILDRNPSLLDSNDPLIQRLVIMAFMEETGFNFEHLQAVTALEALEAGQLQRYFEVDNSSEIITNKFFELDQELKGR